MTRKTHLLRLGQLSAALGALLVAAACGGDKRVDPPPTTGVRIDSFAASAGTVATGGTVTLTWKVSGATAAQITITAVPGGNVTDSEQLEGSVVSGAINADTQFKLTVTAGGKTVEQSVTVRIDASALAILSFTASANPAAQGSTVTLRWTTGGATQVRVLQDGAELLNSTTMVASGMVVSRALDRPSHTFRLEAQNASGTDTEDLVVTTEAPPSIEQFRVSPNVFTGASAPISVTWRATGATVTLTRNGTAVPGFPGTTTGTVSVTVSETSQFVLTVEGAGQRVTATRAVAQAVGETEPNDDIASAQTLGAGGGATGNIDPAGDVDFYAITVAQGGNVYAETGDGVGGCAFDSFLTLYDSAGEVVTDNDDGGEGLCSLIDPKSDPTAADLPAGTYYVAVSGYQDNTGAYSLVVIVGTPGCGNGVIEASAGEQCDDENTTAGDGCSATCQVESNGSVSGLNQSMTFTGAIVPGTRIHYYQVTMPSEGYIAAEVGSPTVGTCDAGVDTIIGLFDSTLSIIGSNNDIDFLEDNLCSHIDPNIHSFAEVAAGSYWVAVGSFEGDAIPTYEIQIRTFGVGCGNGVFEMGEQCDDGNTAAGDGCSATCTIEVAGTISGTGGRVPVTLGDDQSPPQVVEVIIANPGQSITATTTDGASGCPFPTIIQLLDPATFDELGIAFGQGGCAHIDPRVDRFASDLAPGTYWLAVYTESGAGGNVTVEATISNPVCGNGIRETRANEQCDDGGVAPGDGCSATCMFEGNVLVETEPNDMPAQANATSATIGGPAIRITGDISPVADHDLFSFVVPTGRTATLQARTYNTFSDPTSCDGSTDTLLVLLDSTGVELEENDDVGFGTLCSFIDGTEPGSGAANLAAGTYYIQVQHWSDSSTFNGYLMNVTLLP